MARKYEPKGEHEEVSEFLDHSRIGDWDFESSYNVDYGIEDGSDIPFIHNRIELKKLLKPLYIIDDYMESYEIYDQFFHTIYNIIKGCFCIQACREYPVTFKFYRTDKESYTVQLRHFLLDLIVWRPHVELHGIPDILNEDFILEPEKDIPNINDYINEYIILPLREHHVKPTTVNFSTSEVCYELRKISENFSIILNLTFGMDTFLEMYKDNPRIHEIMEAGYDDLNQPYDIEQRINGYQKEVIEILKSEENNPIGIILRSGTGIKHKQLSEFMIAEGLKPSLEGKTIPIPIQNSTILGGLDRPSYLYIDAIGARKSLVTNKKVMGKAGYFGKALTLLVRTLRMSSTVADCGSTHLIPYEIKSIQHLKKLDGKYYKENLDDDDFKVLRANKDKHLIGKKLYFRSIITCCLKDEVCPRCIGLTANINEDIADGFAAFQTEETTKKLNQDVLSTKHLLTTNSEVVLFNDIFDDFFTFTTSEIYPNVNNNEKYGDEINDYAIYIDPADVQKVSELDEDSLFNTVIDRGRFYIRDLKGRYKDQIVCNVNEKGEPEERELYITKEASDIMKKNKGLIPFSLLDDDTKLFEAVIGNNELTKPLYEIMALIDNKRMIENETIETIAQKLLDLLIEAGIQATATSSEMIINRMIRDPHDVYKRPDFSQEKMPPYQIVTDRTALEKNYSPYIGLSYQDIKYQLLSDDLYTKRNHESYLDPLFNTVVPMKNLKEYTDRIDPKSKQKRIDDIYEHRKGTMYDPAFRAACIKQKMKSMQKVAAQ